MNWPQIIFQLIALSTIANFVFGFKRRLNLSRMVAFAHVVQNLIRAYGFLQESWGSRFRAHVVQYLIRAFGFMQES